MLLKYAPKRFDFEYETYKTRNQLAAIDHNIHALRPYALTKDGRVCYHKKYVKRTRTWHLEPIKVNKTYAYKDALLEKAYRLRSTDKDPISKKTEIPKDHPKNLAQTIAMKQPPDTDILFIKMISRKGTAENKLVVNSKKHVII